MDKTVPAGAAHLLAFIYRTETGRDAPECYEVIFGNRQTALKKPLTQMTLDEVEAAQATWSSKAWAAKFKSAVASSAAGAAQFMRNTLDAPKTLRDIEGEMGLTGRERFSPDLQDRMAYHLLKRRGYLEFVAGEISMTQFGNRLAMEWASFPVLSAIKGQKRQLKRGQTYYAGDGINKVLTKPETVEAVLEEVLALDQPQVELPSIPTETLPPPVTTPARPGILPLIFLGIIAAGMGVWVWWSGQQVAEPASVLGGTAAPIPLDRPMKLFGGPGSSLAGEIGLAILMSFIGPLVSAAATYAVGWVVYMWGRVLKTDFDKKSADTLHAALERGILAAIEHFGARTGKATLLASAADYAEQWNGGTVKRFGLTHDDLQELAVPHLAAVKRGAK